MAKNKKTKKRKKGFLQSNAGQRFFNFAYSIGAAIVIWGALFKILHLPGGSTLLCIGMGTEIAMFIITAFDRPPKEYEWEQVFPELSGETRTEGPLPEEETEAQEIYDGDTEGYGEEPSESPGRGHVHGGGGYYGGAPAVIGGGVIGGGSFDGEIPEGGAVAAGGGGGAVIIAGGSGVIGGGGGVIGGGVPAEAASMSHAEELTNATQSYLEKINGIAEQMSRLQETTAQLNQVSEVLLESYKAITDNSETISEGSVGYVESMANLNRNISGLNTIYEIQLKSISSQLDSIDRVNRGLKDIRDMYEKAAHQSARYCEETERMTRYMSQLNSVYEKMVTAMTINMYNPMMGGPQRPADEFNPYQGAENGAEQPGEAN